MAPRAPQKPSSPREPWQLSYAEVRRIMLDMDTETREPIIEGLYGDVVGQARKPDAPPMPRYFLRLWQEAHKAPPLVADMLVSDFAPRYIACVLAAEAAGKSVPAAVLHEVRQRPEYEMVKRLRESCPDQPFGAPVDATMTAVVGFIRRAARSTDLDIAGEARTLLEMMSLTQGVEPNAPR